MYRRLISSHIKDSLADTPVVFVAGARQTGKTTLVENIVSQGYPAQFLTMDDAATLSAATSDPQGFIMRLTGPVVIDEIQRTPELFLPIKLSVDRDRRPGRFLLTGSANVLVLPKLSESLAGRMEILTLWPLAQAEIEGSESNLVDSVYGPPLPIKTFKPMDRTDLVRRILAGGYPEPLARQSHSRRKRWYGSYVTTILQRDVRDFAHLEGLGTMPRLLELLASRTANLLNVRDISSALGMPYTTLQRYLAVLEATYMVVMLPAWSGNIGRRLVKAPKLLINDTGLAASLLDIDEQRMLSSGTLLGPLLENFIGMEIRKHASWSEARPSLYHYRTHTGQEVDLVLEDGGGRIVGIEVKSSGSVTNADFRGLRSLAEATGDRFHRGIVLYTGEQQVPFGNDLYAVPLSVLWT